MVGQPLQDSGLLYHKYFCSSVFLMNCKNDDFLRKVWNVPEIIVDHIIILIDQDSSQSLCIYERIKVLLQELQKCKISNYVVYHIYD